MTTSTLEQLTTSIAQTVIISLPLEKFETLKYEYDVFTRINVRDEIILNANLLNKAEIEELSQMLQADFSKVANNYVVVRCVKD